MDGDEISWIIDGRNPEKIFFTKDSPILKSVLNLKSNIGNCMLFDKCRESDVLIQFSPRHYKQFLDENVKAYINNDSLFSLVTKG